jgi:hypothetical protein
MVRTSKYLGQTYEGWTVTHIGVATVVAKRHKGKGLNKRPGHQSYYYLLERKTSDGKCDKQIRLNASQMCRVARGTFSVELYSDYLQDKKSKKATKKVNYQFIN